MTDQTETADADQIVTASINSDAARATHDAPSDDDQRWIETVLASLPTRSGATRQALIEALGDGEGAMPLLAPFTVSSCSLDAVE